MSRDNLLWIGNHRGALTTARQLTPQTLNRYAPTLLLADPKAGRAAGFGDTLRRQFPSLMLTPTPLVMRGQDALAVNRDLSATVLTVDTLDDTTQALSARRPSQRMTFQICGKGPGGTAGTLSGIQGTLTPKDDQTQKAVSLLLPALSEMSRPANSRELTRPDPLTAAVLQPLRHVVSTRTSLHLGEKNLEPQDLTGSPLSLTFGQTLLPLVAVPGGGGDKYSQQQALALESAGLLPGSTRGNSCRMLVAAIVIPRQAIHFMRVALASSGKRVIAGVSSFVRPVERASSSAAVFTD